ncbi:hypothetical protein Aduo_008228 [Ancylostoma duodenale]
MYTQLTGFNNLVLVALPKPFARLLREANEPATVKFMISSHFGDLADQLDKHCTTAALVWVWPNDMPCSRHIVMVQSASSAVRRNVGGNVATFELSREREWRRIASI